ncbi:TetR/AcrR family transcriptional regulator [Catenulispora sp. NL8]|uniref:TetR/AcrR family transcriptional regulator n=1 Tax=Catenulispora pinistramenti TaxID=2705254 RepID=A0ABS5L625_9ACTN|nr:TetR/AcrR family transcriptional regulator [Catenulispora pinistramenti]MBS2553575.1 TetR/AcrR family transcriptional regulator [Catenulispora pinistramenti]
MNPKPLRADTERTVRAILEAAERVLSANPAAPMEQIAEAAGVARTTVHRRFASREALISALGAWAAQRFHEAVEAARPDTAPPAVALYQVTVNVLRVKIGWGFAMGALPNDAPEVARVHDDVWARCERLFVRLQEAGEIPANADLDWVRRVYYALIHEAALEAPEGDAAIDALATRVIDTLLHGIGASRAAGRAGLEAFGEFEHTLASMPDA